MLKRKFQGQTQDEYKKSLNLFIYVKNELTERKISLIKTLTRRLNQCKQNYGINVNVVYCT